MKHFSTKLNLLSLLILTIISGCNAPVDENVMVMEVNSLKVPCEGVGLRTCLQVKYEGDENWQLFYAVGIGYSMKLKKEKETNRICLWMSLVLHTI